MECRIIAPETIAAFDPSILRQRKLLKVMDSRTRNLVAAAQEAARTAGLTYPVGPRCALCVGRESSTLGRESWNPDPQSLPPLWLLEWLPNMPAAHIALQFGIGGPVHTFAARESALWDQALDLAYEWLETREADCVLAAVELATPRAAIIRPA